MKGLFIKYKAVIKFIFTFLVVYIGLSLLYSWYLDVSDGSKYYPDFITNLVSIQSDWLLELFGYNVEMLPHPNEPSMKVVVNDKYLARIIEGCNSMSVIILFMSFIIAFTGKMKSTITFVALGIVLIYVANLLRIVLLSMGLYHYPEYKHVLHTVVFPAIIYGMVFLLWFVWVNKFSKRSKG
ncbi:exosortase family protein XrtF [Seonamhaeicola marinus]|uniref:Exosortase family protein XrtF n=1 Tax=Seonamhaeicola marinus TaxID=1912246 RepID=A0A5D0HZE8_9FLAO|nr:exosortase family protein XrtF [Seonamhaeicola marinus]TYA74872.1 exosortase family protein XrtF [Seonamhaeicola marinus]